MEADILAFAQQVCTDAYVEGQVASAEASLWGLQIGVAVCGIVIAILLLASAVIYRMELKGSVIGDWVPPLTVAAFVLMVLIFFLILAGAEYQDLIAWQNDPITHVVKDIAKAI